MGLDILVGYPEMRTDPNIQKAGLFLEEVQQEQVRASLQELLTLQAGHCGEAQYRKSETQIPFHLVYK